MEGLLLGLVVLAPWCFGAVHPGFELLLHAGLAVLLLLWAARLFVCPEPLWQRCPVALCLTVCFVTAVWQLVPLPPGWLSALSPRTAELYHSLLPVPREAIPSSYGPPSVPPGAGSTLSLCPGVTEREAIRLLAVLLLFVLVRNNLTGAAQLRRLSFVALGNGVLLSVFAFVQFFRWGPSRLYGVYPTEGAAFGPFICRNHFPYYVNLCLGLGVGLLLTYLVRPSHRRQRSRRSSRAANEANGSSGSRPGDSSRSHTWKGTSYAQPGESDDRGVMGLFHRLLAQPLALAMIFALVLLAAAVLFSASRGGGLALLGAILGCFLIQVRRSASFFQSSALALLVAVPVVVLLSWFGLERLQERWDKLFEVGSASVEQLTSEGAAKQKAALQMGQIDRLALWSANLAGFREFPWWGTGYGTFEFTELLHRDKVEQEGLLYEHAHNDYLEVLLEGGIVGMIPVLVLVGLLLWFGYRAVRRQRESSAGWLATGLFFGLLTLVIHSSVDFGLHVPAITFLATVLCAHLAALGGRRDRAAQPEAGAVVPRRTLPLAGALLLVLFAALLLQQGWKRHKASRLQEAASELVSGIDHPDRALQIAYLQAAVREQPRAPHLRLQLARAQLALYQQAEQQDRDRATLLTLTQEVALLGGSSLAPAGLSAPLTGMVPALVTYQGLLDQNRSRLDQLLMPALASYLATRDLCPILAEPHVRLAASSSRLIGGQEGSAYLERATFLSPVNPIVWYLRGKQQFAEQSFEGAWQSWQHALSLSEMHLPLILKQARERLSEEQLRAKVLPDKPRVLYAAAMYLHPEEGELEERRPYLDKALALLAEQAPPLEAEDLALRALIYDSLGDKKEALAAYQAAVGRAPREISLRLAYARLLYEEGQLREAARHLETILTQQPNHLEAKEMLAQVRKDIARKL